MPIRGSKPIYPAKGKSPTGIFSSKGKQKMDSTSRFSNKDDMNYSKGCSTRSKPKSKTSPNLRHLPKGSKVPVANG